jgi:hypothetical protein
MWSTSCCAPYPRLSFGHHFLWVSRKIEGRAPRISVSLALSFELKNRGWFLGGSSTIDLVKDGVGNIIVNC